MDFRSLKFVATACAGERIGGSPEDGVTRVCSDSRLAQAGDLFFALKGERFDGHDYLREVAQKGATAVVVAKDRAPGDLGKCAVITVDDPRLALGRLAARYRQDFRPAMIAVGGSNGKTSTKDLVATVLRQRLRTLWSEASFNNDIGVPMTLLNLGSEHQAAVLEAGTNHPGELAPLVRMIQPQYGIITSIGREHLEFFRDLDGVATEEGWLAELLPQNGKLFVNGDSEWAAKLSRRTRASVIRVGFCAGNDWIAENISINTDGTRFQVRSQAGDFGGEYRVGLVGRHQVVNTLFALAMGAELGLGRAELAAGLSLAKPAKLRLQMWIWNGVCVLDDSYNANADSMRAALETLREMPGTGKRVAVLGDMAELGEHAAAAHAEVGRVAAELGLDQLVAVGQMAGITAEAARNAGMRGITECGDVPEAVEAVRRLVVAGDLLLLKASRSSRLERIGEALRTTAGKC